MLYSIFHGGHHTMVFDAAEEKQGGSDELASVWHGPIVVLESE